MVVTMIRCFESPAFLDLRLADFAAPAIKLIEAMAGTESFVLVRGRDRELGSTLQIATKDAQPGFALTIRGTSRNLTV
jgi:hypothetical protein